jgi:exodeoxyribonuclease-3
MERLRVYLHSHYRPTDPLVLAGDFNVAPEDRDVYDPPAWANESICHPEARKGLEALRRFGFEDVYRQHHPEGGQYTWWDYRMNAFPRNQGLRIDHIFATAPLAARCTGTSIDRASREGEQPSDHAAVVAEFSG